MYELWIRKEICVIKAVYFLHTCNIMEKTFYMRHQMMTNFHVVFKRQMEFLHIMWSLLEEAFQNSTKTIFIPTNKLTRQFISTKLLMMIKHKKQIKKPLNLKTKTSSLKNSVVSQLCICSE